MHKILTVFSGWCDGGWYLSYVLQKAVLAWILKMKLILFCVVAVSFFFFFSNSFLMFNLHTTPPIESLFFIQEILEYSQEMFDCYNCPVSFRILSSF